MIVSWSRDVFEMGDRVSEQLDVERLVEYLLTDLEREREEACRPSSVRSGGRDEFVAISYRLECHDEDADKLSVSE